MQEQHALCVAPAPTSLVRLRPTGGLAAWRRGEALAVQLQRRLSEEVRAGGLKCHLPEKPLGQVVESSWVSGSSGHELGHERPIVSSLSSL